MPIIRTGPPMVNSVIISNHLTQMVNFPTHISECDSHSPALLDLFVSSDASTYSAIIFSYAFSNIFSE